MKILFIILGIGVYLYGIYLLVNDAPWVDDEGKPIDKEVTRMDRIYH